MSEKEVNSRYSISGVAEFSALSKVLTFLLIIAAIFSLALYIWMAIPPGKVHVIDDQAGVFSAEESGELLAQMEAIQKEKDINVMVVTVTDKGADYQRYDESQSIRYAQDRFKELSLFESLRDNSGVLILLELDGDYHFFYIVTFGTAKASITNSECKEIFSRQGSLLASGQYKQAIQNSLDDISDHNFTSVLLILTYAAFIIAPFLIAVPIVRLIARRKKYEITATTETYLDPDAENVIQKTDVYDSDGFSEVTYTEDENDSWETGGIWIILRIILILLSGGRGGRGGGGGSFGGGRGGGGRFGGGGGRF